MSVGKGYVLSEELKSNKYPVGTILLDSLFSPVTKVNYEVENTRVEQILNYDRLVMEVWTDSSIFPQDALIKAARILRNSLVIFTGDVVESEESVAKDVIEEKKTYAEEGIFEQHVSTMDLSTRALNSLKNEGVETIGDLVQIKEDDILNFDNFGKRSFEEIKGKLEKLNLTLGMKIKSGAKK